MGPVPKFRTALQIGDNPTAGVQAVNSTGFDKAQRNVTYVTVDCYAPIPAQELQWIIVGSTEYPRRVDAVLASVRTYLSRTVVRSGGSNGDPVCIDPSGFGPPYSFSSSQNATTLAATISSTGIDPTPDALFLPWTGIDDVTIHGHTGVPGVYFAGVGPYDSPLSNPFWPTVGAASTTFFEYDVLDCLNNNVGSSVAVNISNLYDIDGSLEILYTYLTTLNMAPVWDNPSGSTVRLAYMRYQFDAFGMFPPWVDSSGNPYDAPYTGDVLPRYDYGLASLVSTTFTSGRVVGRIMKTGRDSTSGGGAYLQEQRTQVRFEQLTKVLIVECAFGYANTPVEGVFDYIKMYRLAGTQILDAGTRFEVPHVSTGYHAASIYNPPEVGPVVIFEWDVQVVVGFETVAAYAASLVNPSAYMPQVVVSSWT